MKRNIKNINTGRSLDKELLMQLASVAVSDGTIHKSERLILYEFGRKKGLPDNEIAIYIEQAVQQSRKHALPLPERFEFMYYVVRTILADGVIENNEMRTATSIALKLGFRDEEVSGLMYILINGIKTNLTTEALFETFNAKYSFS